MKIYQVFITETAEIIIPEEATGCKTAGELADMVAIEIMKMNHIFKLECSAQVEHGCKASVKTLTTLDY